MSKTVQELIPTRHSLLERLKKLDDRTSWQDFFSIYWRLIYNVAIKAGLTDSEAQEVVQETVIAVSRKIQDFKADPARGSFSAWLMQLTRWRIADQFRQRAIQRRRGIEVSTLAQGHETPGSDPMKRVADPAGNPLEAIWTEEWQANLLATGLEKVKGQVSARQYQMFDLCALQNLTVRETARALGVSVASVHMAKSRVSRLLKRTMSKLSEQSL